MVFIPRSFLVRTTVGPGKLAFFVLYYIYLYLHSCLRYLFFLTSWQELEKQAPQYAKALLTELFIKIAYVF